MGSNSKTHDLWMKWVALFLLVNLFGLCRPDFCTSFWTQKRQKEVTAAETVAHLLTCLLASKKTSHWLRPVTRFCLIGPTMPENECERHEYDSSSFLRSDDTGHQVVTCQLACLAYFVNSKGERKDNNDLEIKIMSAVLLYVHSLNIFHCYRSAIRRGIKIMSLWPS